jgi:hypothetical protein
MSDATWTPRTAREREAVVGLCVKAIRAWIRGDHAIAGKYADALVPPVPAPTTRLREYKGVTYRDGYFRYRDGVTGTSEAVVACLWWIEIATDADHAALLDLKDNPTENAPDAVVEALVAFYHDKGGEIEETIQSAAERTAATVRALVRAEVEAQPAPALTVAQHVAALVGMGARVYSNLADDEMRFAGRRDLVLLPPEAP